jgi:hypothetical protein
LLEAERARISLEQEASAAVFESRLSQWSAFLKTEREHDGSGALMCHPLPYAADTQIIGPAGGELTIGRHTLSIPAGALTEYTVITGEQVVSTHLEVELAPHGLRFLRQPTLMMNYEHCSLPSARDFTIAYLGDEGA